MFAAGALTTTGRLTSQAGVSNSISRGSLFAVMAPSAGFGEHFLQNDLSVMSFPRTRYRSIRQRSINYSSLSNGSIARHRQKRFFLLVGL